MSLKEKLDQDLKAAMRAAEEIKLSVIRGLKTSVMNAEISKKKELLDEDILSLIQTAVKQRKESIEQFKAGNRADLADREEAEKKILESYLPEQMSADDVRKLIEKVIAETGATSAKNIGAVMGKLMPLVKGKADGGMVNQIVRELLK